MKKLFYLTAAFLLGCVMTAIYMQSHPTPTDDGNTQTESVTATSDTLTSAQPAVRESTVVRYETRLLPRFLPNKGRHAEMTALVTDGRSDTAGPYCDSVLVTLPVEQKQYGDSSYRAWVSGIGVTLDSIEIYRKTETVVRRKWKPPERWGLGLSAGCALTPRGVEPYIGIGITYTLMTWK